MDLSIIILNYNSKDFLLPCIKGIVEHTPPQSPPYQGGEVGGLAYEIIIVDNASTDGSVSYVEQNILPRFPVVRLVKAEQNRGYAAGNNLGFKEAKGRYCLIMNPDIVIWENAFRAMVQFMDERPQAGIAGPRLLSPDGSLQYFCYRFPTPQVLAYRRTPLARFSFARRAINDYLMTDWDHSQNRRVDWLQGSCMIIRASALADVGLMDERYFLFLEDTDWCRRFWEKEWEVWYCSDIEIIHYHSRASDTGRFYKALTSKMAWVHVASAFKYFTKWGVRPPVIRHAP